MGERAGQRTTGSVLDAAMDHLHLHPRGQNLVIWPQQLQGVWEIIYPAKNSIFIKNGGMLIIGKLGSLCWELGFLESFLSQVSLFCPQ